MVEDAEALGSDQELRFEVELAPELWVEADWSLLQPAVLNLLHNATKYNEPGGRVRVNLALNGGRVELEIGNSGPGIPTEEQARVFDRFCRLDTARHRGVDGVGLGLSLAREIVRAHGGDVVLKDRRKLVLALRETPLHLGHVRLMAEAIEMGAIIMPPMPAFYHRPQTVDDIINQSVNRILDLFDIELTQDLFERWQGPAYGKKDS